MTGRGRFCRAALMCVAGAVLAGCEPGVPPDAKERDIVRPTFRFALDVPDGWTVRDLAGDVVLEAVAPRSETEPAGKGAPRSPGVVHVLVIEHDDFTLQDWASEAIAESLELQTDLEVVSRQEDRLADGREALRIVLKNPRAVEPQVQWMLLALGKGRAYALIATAGESQMASLESQVTQCFRSFVVW